MRTETHEETFTYFDDWEDEAIEAWLEERGYTWSFPTLCGSCCGYWDQEFWVPLKPADIAAFNEFAKSREIPAKAHPGGIMISA